MNTSPVNNVANLFQTTTPNAPKADASATSESGSFNQVLSREMSSNDTRNTAQSSNANSTSNNNNVNNNNDVAKAAQKDNGNGDNAKSDASADTADAKTAEATKKADDDKVASGKDVKKDDDKDSDDQTVTADPAGIAAFVAALTSAKAAPAENAAATAVAVSTAPATGKALTDTDIKGKNDRIDLATKLTDGDATASDKDAIGKKSDFVSAMDKATANAGDSSKATTGNAKAEADIAAATQTLKVLDAPAANTPQTFAAVVAAATAIQPRNDAQQMNSSNTLLPPVGGEGWNDALGQKVVWMAKGVEQTATLTLNPPDLGPMQVTVNVNNNQATASFTAHQPEVRHALEASMPRLREMLNEAGIQLGQSSVSAGMPNQQNGFDGSQQGSNGGRRAQSANAIDSAVHVSHVPTPAAGNGIINTFA